MINKFFFAANVRILVIILAVVSCLALATPQAIAQPIVVEKGWDCFETIQPTYFMDPNYRFEGVPLESFDFGGIIGVQNTGTADAIVQRMDSASVPNAPATADPIDIELIALQLVSVDPVDFGAGLDYHYITLQTGMPSTGQMTITFNNENSGTFDSFIDVHFDMRIGALNGPIIMSQVLQLFSNDVAWDRTAPPGALLINGVNNLLNGVDTTADFWPDPFTEEKLPPFGSKHSVKSASPSVGIPTLSQWGLIVLALLLLLTTAVWMVRRRRRTAAA